eukprot:Pgem_evm1s18998
MMMINDDDNLTCTEDTCTEDTCHFLISCELYKEFREKFLFDIFNLKLDSFQEKWESLDEKRRCVLLFRFNKDLYLEY